MAEKLPVGEEENTAEEALAEFKKDRFRRPTRDEITRQAGITIAEVKQKMDQGFIFRNPIGQQLEQPEQVLQLTLSKKPYEVFVPFFAGSFKHPKLKPKYFEMQRSMRVGDAAATIAFAYDLERKVPNSYTLKGADNIALDPNTTLESFTPSQNFVLVIVGQSD